MDETGLQRFYGWQGSLIRCKSLNTSGTPGIGWCRSAGTRRDDGTSSRIGMGRPEPGCKANCALRVFRRAKEKTRNRHRCGLPLSSRSPAHRHGFCGRMMNANEFPVYMQCSIYSRQEKARWNERSGLKSIPCGNGGDRCIVRHLLGYVSQRMPEPLVGLSLRDGIWCWYCCLPPAPEDAPAIFRSLPEAESACRECKESMCKDDDRNGRLAGLFFFLPAFFPASSIRLSPLSWRIESTVCPAVRARHFTQHARCGVRLEPVGP